MRQFLLGLSLCMAFIATAAPTKQPTEIQQLQQQVEALQTTANQQQEDIKQLHQQNQKLSNDFSVYTQVSGKQLDLQDKRISDFGIVVAILGILITLVIFAASLATYVSVRNRVTQEAKAASQEWFEKRSTELTTVFETHLHRVTVIENDVKEHAEKTKQKMDEDREKVALAADIPIASSYASTTSQPSPADQQKVQAADQVLKAKPENEFTALEHYVRGFSEFNANRFDSALVNFEKALDAAAQKQYPPKDVAKFMFALAITYGKLNRFEDEIKVYDNLTQQFDRNTSPALRKQLTRALNNKGFRLGQLERREDQIKVYDDLVQRFGSDTNHALREQVAIALVSKGYTLGQLNRSEDAIQVYDDLIQQFGSDTSPGVRVQVARALVNKGLMLGNLRRSEDAIHVFNELVQQFGDDPSPALREQVAKALLSKGFELEQVKQTEDSIQVYYDLVQRFGADTSPGVRKLVAQSLLYKAITLKQLDRKEEAISAYELVVQKYADDSEPEIQELVARAKRLLSKLQGGDDEAATPA